MLLFHSDIITWRGALRNRRRESHCGSIKPKGNTKPFLNFPHLPTIFIICVYKTWSSFSTISLCLQTSALSVIEKRLHYYSSAELSLPTPTDLQFQWEGKVQCLLLFYAHLYQSLPEILTHYIPSICWKPLVSNFETAKAFVLIINTKFL